MNRRETADAAPHPPIRSGLAERGIQSTVKCLYCLRPYPGDGTLAHHQDWCPLSGRSDPPVKPTSEVAHQPGQQTSGGIEGARQLLSSGQLRPEVPGYAAWPGSAEECSAERQRAPETQPVAPAEGRAWETPATRTV